MTLLSFQCETAVGAIPKFSASWGPGLHVLVKSVDGSTAALFGALSGSTPARGCTTKLGKGVPWLAVAHIPEAIPWPRDLTVSEALAIAAAARQTALSSVYLLDQFALGGLRKARVRELDPATLRAIALLEAVGSDSVRILLLDEGPLDGRVAPSLLSLLRTRAADGAAVLVAARECGTVRDPASEIVLRSEGRIRVDTRDPVVLSQALAKHTHLRVEQSGGSTLWIENPSTEKAINAINHAVAETRVAIDRLEVAS